MSKNQKSKWTKIRLMGLFLVMASFSYSQQTVTGTVVSSDDGIGIPGVNVVVKGTSNGTSTDFDGNYSIDISTDNPVLVFTYLGFITQEINVGGRNVIDASMSEDVSALDEVVVVGYGTTKKSDITGSVSSVKSEELDAFPVLSAEQALQGRAAGVAVQSNNGGEPGASMAVSIRGNTSIGASSAALVVVDGFVGAACRSRAISNLSKF